MNPNDTHNEALSLPTPISPESTAQSRPAADSALPSSPEVLPIPGTPAPSMSAQGAHLPSTNPQQTGPLVDPSATNIPAPQATSTDDLDADDADLIEKEWVVKAKAIVDRTKDDPHTQTKQINRVKADYIKKRYNKDIKVSE